MTTLNSINQFLPSLAYFKRCYILHEFSGVLPENAQYISGVYADFDTETGECTGIYDYAVGEARMKRHFNADEGVAVITDTIENWMRGEIDRKTVCREIQTAIQKKSKSDAEPPRSVAGLVPIEIYAKEHGVSPDTVRQKCLRGGWTTAVKLGRAWFIDPDEPYTDHRRKPDSNK